MPATAPPATIAAPPVTSPGESRRAAARRSADLEQAIAREPAAFRILTGDRPTGALHLGHYFGTLQNRVRLQDAGAELFVLVADYQVITDRTAAAGLPADVLGLVADYLAVGIDPGRAVIFAHSQVAALHQLLLPFLSLVSVAEVGRNPTVKDEMAAAGPAGVTALMFSYPVHQAADILSVHAGVVPVGQDQLPHLELARTIARRFNDRYSPGQPYFREPRRAARRGPAAARHGRHQDEQEPRERGADPGHRGRDGPAHRGRPDRRRAGHHLRAGAPPRGGQPAAAGRAVPGRAAGAGGGRNRRRRGGRT